MTITEEKGSQVEVAEHYLSIADVTGDLRFTWDPADADQVKIARDAFTAAKQKGMLSYTVKPGGGSGEVIREFDPAHEAIIMTPQHVGG